MSPTENPSTRRLLEELAAIEDRMHAVRASRTPHGAPTPADRELLRLARREEQVLALLRLARDAP